MKQRAAAYLRVSTEDQRERSTIDTQRDAIARYCRDLELRVVDYFEDEAISGSVPLGSRPQGRRLLDDARAGRFDTVVVYKLDRIARDAELLFAAVRELSSLGIRLVSPTEALEVEGPEGALQIGIKAVFAQYERDLIIQRSMAGSRRLAREGKWQGGIVPYGYRMDGADREARLVVSDETISGAGMSEADVVRMIYRLSAEEGKSTIAIASHLNSMQIPTHYARDERQVEIGKRKRRTAATWRSGGVGRILRSSTYRGEYWYGKRSSRGQDPIRQDVPRIIDDETWFRAQEVMDSNRRFSPRNVKAKYLLRGLMKCYYCGLTFVGSSYMRADGGRNRYYGCNGRLKGHEPESLLGNRCFSKPINARDVEELVWGDIEGFLSEPLEVTRLLESELDSISHDEANAATEAAEVQRLIHGIEKQRDRVVTAYAQGSFDSDTLDRQLAKIADEEVALRDRLAAMEYRQRSVGISRERIGKAEDLLEELRNKLDEGLSWETRREIVETLVSKVVVRSEIVEGQKDVTIYAAYLFPVDTRTGTDCGRQPA